MSAILDTIRTFKLSGYIRIAWIRGRYPEYRPQLPLRREVSVSRNTIHPNISMGSRNFEGFAWPSSHRTNSTAYYGIASTLLRSIGPLISMGAQLVSATSRSDQAQGIPRRKEANKMVVQLRLLESSILRSIGLSTPSKSPHGVCVSACDGALAFSWCVLAETVVAESEGQGYADTYFFEGSCRGIPRAGQSSNTVLTEKTDAPRKGFSGQRRSSRSAARDGLAFSMGVRWSRTLGQSKLPEPPARHILRGGQIIPFYPLRPGPRLIHQKRLRYIWE